MATTSKGSDVKVALDKKERVLVASIDFGTTFSGYAFSFKHEYKAQPDKVNTYQWSEGLMSLKAPTVVLFNPEGEFDSFGYDAEENYLELARSGEFKDWYYFKRFKMELYHQKISRDVEIKDVSGKKKMKALKVFGAVIAFLKNHLLSELEDRGTAVAETDIHWVLTVPAIWSDSAKQFMREAAYEAEIDGALLSIALEPEAASLYCQTIPTERIVGTDGTRFTVTSSGSKYMVIDLGGGTADITIHQVQEDGTLKEVHKATGGAWGGTKVDDEFSSLLVRIVGGPVMKTFREEHMEDFLDLQREFEAKKRTKMARSSKKNITMKVPVKIAEIYKDECDEEIKSALEGNDDFKGKIDWTNDKLRLDINTYKSLFKPCQDSLVKHIRELMDKPDVQGTNTFLMVGGFSESDFMQEAVKKAFPKVRVIIPQEAGLAVLKGAVIFGHKPVSITSRVSKYTYGINISPPFDSTNHPHDHRVSVAGIDRCRDVFKKYIREGETLSIGEIRSGKHVTLKSQQREMLLKVFGSPKQDPRFVDEDDAFYIGNLIVNLPESDEKVRVNVNMICGETELKVEAEETTTNTTYTAYFDFL